MKSIVLNLQGGRGKITIYLDKIVGIYESPLDVNSTIIDTVRGNYGIKESPDEVRKIINSVTYPDDIDKDGRSRTTGQKVTNE